VVKGHRLGPCAG